MWQVILVMINFQIYCLTFTRAPLFYVRFVLISVCIYCKGEKTVLKGGLI